MEGVGIVSNDGHVLFVRQRKEAQIPSSQLLAFYAAAKFSQEEAQTQILSTAGNKNRVIFRESLIL